VTLLEAEAVSARIVCSDITAHRELASPGADFVNFRDPLAVAGAMQRLEENRGQATSWADPAFRQHRRTDWSTQILRFLRDSPL
jgi:hypothetical protein